MFCGSPGLSGRRCLSISRVTYMWNSTVRRGSTKPTSAVSSDRMVNWQPPCEEVAWVIVEPVVVDRDKITHHPCDIRVTHGTSGLHGLPWWFWGMCVGYNNSSVGGRGVEGGI